MPASASATGMTMRRSRPPRHAARAPRTTSTANSARSGQRHVWSAYATSMLRIRWLPGSGMMKYTRAISNNDEEHESRIEQPSEAFVRHWHHHDFRNGWALVGESGG